MPWRTILWRVLPFLNLKNKAVILLFRIYFIYLCSEVIWLFSLRSANIHLIYFHFTLLFVFLSVGHLVMLCLCLFRVAIFVFVCCLLFSFPVVSSSSQLWWWITTWRHFNVETLLVFLGDHNVLLNRESVSKMALSIVQIESFSLTYF